MANPKGNPNIVEYGKATRFGTGNGCTAADAGRKSQEAQAVARSYYELAKGEVSDEMKLAHIKMLEEHALDGDIKALELLLKIMKEYEDKLSVEGNGFEIRVHNVE